MSWSAFAVIFRLRSPMHIGIGKTGNVQKARLFVTGRNIWGALTERLTRDAANGRQAADDTLTYDVHGRSLHTSLRYTYFYPAVPSSEGEGYTVLWPWHRGTTTTLLSAQVGTALAPDRNAAAHTTLHEIEYLSPNTLTCPSSPVYLVGYIFEQQEQIPWRSALYRLQLGGERTYGWGKVTPTTTPREVKDGRLFNGALLAILSGPEPLLEPQIDAHSNDTHPRLLGHAPATTSAIRGKVEPLVGREWRSRERQGRNRAGQHIEYADLCYAPGALCQSRTRFSVDKNGVWQPES